MVKSKIIPLRKTIKDITKQPKLPKVKPPMSSDPMIAPNASKSGVKLNAPVNLPGIKT